MARAISLLVQRAVASMSRMAQPRRRRTAPVEGPAGKRVAGSQRALPSQVQVVSMDKDGSCLFAAIASGLNKLRKNNNKECSAAESGRRLRCTFTRTRSNTPRASLSCELRVVCGMFGAWFFLLASTSSPSTSTAKPRSVVIGLYFTGSHYDLLEGAGGALPKSILNIKAARDEVLMRGW